MKYLYCACVDAQRLTENDDTEMRDAFEDGSDV